MADQITPELQIPPEMDLTPTPEILERFPYDIERQRKAMFIIKFGPILLEKKRRKYLNSFYLFNKEVLKWPDIYEPLHKRVCDFIQDTLPTKNCLLLLPRGTFKSSIVTVGYPMWRLAKDIASRGIIANATDTMARSFLGQIERQLQTNMTFKDLYGDLFTGAPIWREEQFLVAGNTDMAKKKEASLRAIGITTNAVGSHCDYAILDDLVNRENIRSKEGLDKPKQYYKDVLDLVDPNEIGRKPIIVIGTTWHDADLYAWLQDKNEPVSREFETLKLPAYTGDFGKGELLFPKRLSWDVLESLKNQQGSSHFSAQYLLDPVPMEDAIFKMQFRYYEETDIKGLNLLKFIAVDPAISEKKEADYSAMVCVGVAADNTWYILDIWKDKVAPNRLIDQIFFWDEKWHPTQIAIETVAFQRMLQFTIWDEIKKRNHNIPIKELKHQGDRTKDQRIRALEPRYEMGSIFHNKYVAYNEDFELELRRFNKGHDDMIDALSMILEIAYPPQTHDTRKKRGGFFGRRRYPA